MHPILEDHLSLTEPPAMFDLYVRAHALFAQYGLEALDTQFEDLMCTADGAVDGQSLASNQAIYALTVQCLDHILTQHQIAVAHEAHLSARVDVLEFIKQLDVTELVEDCQKALAFEDYDNIDKFVRCMSIVTGIAEEDILLYIEPIPDCVIKTLKEFIDGRCAFEVAVQPLDESIKEIYRDFDKFSRAVGGAQMQSHQYIFDNEGAVDMPFAFYFELHRDYLLSLETEDMALECIGFSIMSEDGRSNPSKAIMQELSKYITELNHITKVHTALQLQLVQYRNEITCGVSLVNG